MNLRMVASSLFCLAIFVIGSVLFNTAPEVFAEDATVDALRQKIEEKNVALKKIEQEIQQYRQQVTTTGQQATTLKSEVNKLATTEQKLRKDISATESKIDIAALTIQKITKEIELTGKKIDTAKDAVASSLRTIAHISNTTVTEFMLGNRTFADAWVEVENQRTFQKEVREKTTELSTYKDELLVSKSERLGQQKTLQELRGELSDRTQLVVQNKQQQSTLLSQTRNKEAEYQRMLAESLKRKVAFEQEIRDFESAIKVQLDPSSIPKFGSGVLSSPLDDVFITQPFGDTEFSRSNAFVYNGNGHNGVDFRATPGTRIKAALEGVITGTGDTDLGCPRASYGKWVLIQHPNGLSTLYAHLSSITATKGQQVGTGSVIGYSGNTGYSTGPHLHFTVYATQGVTITTRPSRACGRDITLPVADLKAYLNPLQYL